MVALGHPNRKQRVSDYTGLRFHVLLAWVGTEGYRRHRDTTGQREASQDPRGPTGEPQEEKAKHWKRTPGDNVGNYEAENLRGAWHSKHQEEKQLWRSGWGGVALQVRGIQKAFVAKQYDTWHLASVGDFSRSSTLALLSAVPVSISCAFLMTTPRPHLPCESLLRNWACQTCTGLQGHYL